MARTTESLLQDAINRMHLQWFAEGDGDDPPSAPEGVQDFLNSDDGKRWFKTVAPTLGFKTPEEIEAEKKGVANKNREVIQANKKLKERLEVLENTGESFSKLKRILADYDVVDDSDELDYDSVERTLSRLRREGDGDPGELDELQRQLKRSQRDFDQLKKELALRDSKIEEREAMIGERDNVISNLLIDGAFKSALAVNGYSELIVRNILPALRATSKAEVQKDEETGDYKAVTDDGRSIEDWVKIWKDTDEGKALRLSSPNGGGGGRGSGASSGVTKAFSEMSAAERMKLFKDNPELYRKKREEAKQG